MGQDLRGKLVKIKPASWLHQFRGVLQMTWAPGEPLLIEDKLMSNGGWHEHPDALAINRYQPPNIVLGDAAKAAPWVNHVRAIYPAEVEHIMDCFAHRVQRPGQKLNHAVVLGGVPGIGKDAIVEVLRPCRPRQFPGDLAG